jgi:hypothetical protein
VELRVVVYLVGLFIGHPEDEKPILHTKIGKGLRFSKISPVRVSALSPKVYLIGMSSLRKAAP